MDLYIANPYGNVYIKSFHSIIRKEEIQYKKYHDFEEAGRAILRYTESWYNRKRIHSSTDYMTPQAYKDATKLIA